MAKSPCSIGAGLQCQVDVRIGGLIPRSPVSHDQKGRIVVGLIQEMVTIASACRECDTRAGPTVSRPASVTSTNSPAKM